jgi:hypothetical protein
MRKQLRMIRVDSKQTITTLQTIEEIAETLCREKRSWHFHILTPNCMLSDSTDHAFILESPTSKECFVYYCSDKPMELGKRLAKLLHGEDILQEVSDSTIGQVSSSAATIIRRAEELSASDILWHHHMLFPDCMFNEHQGKWTIIFEDPESEKILESTSDDEPRSALRKLEVLFYRQET